MEYQDENWQEWLTIESRTNEGSIEVEEVEFDPTRPDHNYTQIPHYFDHYWTPLLGINVALTYDRIRLFAHSETALGGLSIGLLANILTMDRHTLTGRMRRDHRQGHCRVYYQKGVLQQLVETGLLRIEPQKHHGGRIHYKFIVLKYPPLLSPDQIAQLPSLLQSNHREVLDRWGGVAEVSLPNFER